MPARNFRELTLTSEASILPPEVIVNHASSTGDRTQPVVMIWHDLASGDIVIGGTHNASISEGMLVAARQALIPGDPDLEVLGITPTE